MSVALTALAQSSLGQQIMWPAGQLLAPPPHPIVVPEVLSVVSDTCLAVGEASVTASSSDTDDIQVVSKKIRVTLEGHSGEVPQQGLTNRKSHHFWFANACSFP